MLILVLFFSCEEETNIDLKQEDLIPKPRRIQVSNGSFLMTADTPINMIGDIEVIQPIVDHLNERIAESTGFNLTSRSKSGASNGINFFVNAKEDGKLTDGYSIEVVKNNLVISADGGPGLFNGVQTLMQMFPPEINASSLQEVEWRVGTGTIRDRPSFEYRGVMLDVARHFFSVEDVKKVIDYVSSYKFNRLHLHLSDDQGWRIEIKSWPKLTTIGGKTQVGGAEGGFYTQEQYKEIVDYAASKFITIVPEIDMPGHTNAALASYPELNCNNKSPELYTGIEVGFSTLCTDKEVVYQFAEDVIKELAEMTPGEYIHLGGDETHATSEEDYIKFFTRVIPIAAKYGKKVIGWDEIALVDLPDSTVVQFWDEDENAKKAVMQGARVIMSPAKNTYLDMQYDSTTRIGLHWAAYIEADDAYKWEPDEYVEGIEMDNIYGVEAPLWSETVENMEDIEYMLFPRLTAIAELAWTAKNNRSWEGYSERLANHAQVWEVKGVNYYKSPKIKWDMKEIED